MQSILQLGSHIRVRHVSILQLGSHIRVRHVSVSDTLGYFNDNEVSTL